MSARRLIARLAAPMLAVAAIVGLPAAASAVPVVPMQAPGQQVLFPGVQHAHYAYQSWQAQFGGSYYSDYQRLTWPDASMVTLGSYDGASLGPYGTFETRIDPWAGTVGRRMLSAPLNEHRSDYLIDERWVLSADNRQWSLRYADESSSKRGRLIARDATGRVRSVSMAPVGVGRPQAIVPTSKGLRLVTESDGGLRLVDRGWRTKASYRFPKRVDIEDGPYMAAAAPLRDGSVVVSLITDARRTPGRLIRLRPGRHAQVLGTGPVVRRLARAADGLVGVDDDGGVVAVDDRGKRRYRSWEQLELPTGMATCSRSRRWSHGSVVGTNGRALVPISCGADYPNRGVTVELDGRGRIHQIYDLAAVFPPPPAGLSAVEWPSLNGQRLVETDAPMADGSLPFPTLAGTAEEDSTGWSTWLPNGSAPPRRGRFVLKPGAGNDGLGAAASLSSVRLAITCQTPYGRRCGGVAAIYDANDRLVGSTRYSLPGRPGRAAARDELDVPVSGPVASVDELHLRTSPLPARPFLDPARPTWDGSIPW